MTGAPLRPPPRPGGFHRVTHGATQHEGPAFGGFFRGDARDTGSDVPWVWQEKE